MRRREARNRAMQWTLFVMAGLAACGGDGGDPATTAGEAFEIDEAPRLSVGVAEGDTLQEFHRVRSPFLLQDGRLVVPLNGANALRVFDASGQFLATLGREGEGPGEFRYLTSAWARADTIEAFDMQLNRVTRFLPDGQVETVTLRSELPDLSAVAGPMGDGWAVGGVASGGYGRRDELAFHRFGRDGSDLGEIARVQGFLRYSAPGLGGGPTPLSPTAIRRVSGNRLYVAETLTPVIRIFGEDASATRELAFEFTAGTAPASEVLVQVIDSAVARAPAEQAETLRRRLEAAPPPDQLSVFWGLVVDDEGLLWIRRFEPSLHAAALGGLAMESGGPGGEWTIYSPDGVELGTARMPADLEPVMITSDAVVGIARSALGVETVRVHALRRR